jgi:hypothetical protein
MNRRTVGSGALSLILVVGLFAAPAFAFTVCGRHDGPYPLTAYYSQGDFWVNLLEEQVAAWNRVHPVLDLHRVEDDRVPLGRDDRSVVTWLAETDLSRYYHLDWSSAVAWTVTWAETDGGCEARILETDVLFNPAIDIFAPQGEPPYDLGFQEIALHELGHVLGHEHEDAELAVMTSTDAVSSRLYGSDKVGWLRSAAVLLPVRDELDMGVFPLRQRGMGGRSFSRVEPGRAVSGDELTVRDLTVQNLSSEKTFDTAAFRVVLRPESGGGERQIGRISWTAFPPYQEWSGSLGFVLPEDVPPGRYRVVIELDGQDMDASNDRAVVGEVEVEIQPVVEGPAIDSGS